MDYGLRYPFHNYGNQFAAIGENIGGWNERRKLQNVLSEFNGDHQAAAEQLMRMGMVDAAVKIYSAGALSDYRTGMLGVAQQKVEPSWEEKLIAPYLPGNQGPSYVGPPDTGEAADAAEAAEASGTSVPGISTYAPRDLKRAPKKVQDILAPVGDIKEWETEATGKAQRQGQRDALVEAAPNIQQIITQAFGDAKGFDPNTFENALGPLQGADDPNTWQEALGTRGAQTWGSLLNYMQHTQGQGLDALTKPVDQLPGGLTSTVRDNVKATQATLINFLQRIQRVPGIGAQSDKELQQIIDQVGKLQNARTVDDYYNRLTALVTRLNQSGIPIKLPDVDEVSGVQPTAKSAERYSNPSPQMDADVGGARKVPTYNVDPATGSMSPTVNENTMVGGENIGRTTGQPPTPPARALNALRAYAKNPEARAAFDEIYGPGAAEFYLQKHR
jgi:hypothetical protein